MRFLFTEYQKLLIECKSCLNTALSYFSFALTPENTEQSEEKNITDTPKDKIITTGLELEAFYIVRGILAGTIPIEDIIYRDTESYFGILYQGNNRKTICRINLDKKNKSLYIPDKNKSFKRIYIDSPNDLYTYKDKLINSAQRYLDK